MSGLFFWILKAIRFKNRIDFLRPPRSAGGKAPWSPGRDFQVSAFEAGGRRCWTLTPGAGEPSVHVLYFHGGGYSFEASRLHFIWMKKITARTGSALSYIDYPKAPEADARETLAACLEAQRVLAAAHPGRKFVFMGDSAGGGLALALAMELRDAGLPGPAQMILFSPWLDIALKNPGIPGMEAGECILDPAGLRAVGACYRGDLGEEDPRVSPLKGDLAGLGRIAVFFGDREILAPDCRELVRRGLAAGASIEGFEVPGMQHDWVILPLAETKKTLEEVARLLA